MPYPEYLIAPMRQEMTEVGARECRTPEQVDEVLKSPGVVMMVVNSVCGCAAGKARPGIAMSLSHSNKPDTLATVFAGADIEATARAREYLKDFAPSSPSIALLRDGRRLEANGHRPKTRARDSKSLLSRDRAIARSRDHSDELLELFSENRVVSL
jgi:putative YphP/YqiW family bacilliredoxin